ncbi:MAG: type II toxin-antitoxin system RelE/ParE family toxin [Coriobacteriales bacterium]|nr:type II toxin-antitoxin system RelE/ParE family toxin [Coriobacteriales bacterium]
MRSIKYSDGFIADVAAFEEQLDLDLLDRVLEGIETFPSHGSPCIRFSLSNRFGSNARKVPIGVFLIIYTYDDESDEVIFAGIIPQRAVV